MRYLSAGRVSAVSIIITRLFAVVVVVVPFALLVKVFPPPFTAVSSAFCFASNVPATARDIYHRVTNYADCASGAGRAPLEV